MITCETWPGARRCGLAKAERLPADVSDASLHLYQHDTKNCAFVTASLDGFNQRFISGSAPLFCFCLPLSSRVQY